LLIDPFVVIAQLVNFAILVWLLQRFLYGPVTRAMAARESRVRAVMDEARELRAAAEAEGEQYRALLTGFATEREARLVEVHAEVDALRQTQVRAARAEVMALRERWHHTLQQEKDAFLGELRTRVGQESLLAMRRAFTELADDDLQHRLITRFLIRLRTMKPGDRDGLVAAARGEGGVFHLITALPPSDAHRAELSAVLAETFEMEAPLRFETNPELVAGVELRAGGVKVAWTIDHYLDSLEEALREIFPDIEEMGVDDVAS